MPFPAQPSLKASLVWGLQGNFCWNWQNTQHLKSSKSSELSFYCLLNAKSPLLKHVVIVSHTLIHPLVHTVLARALGFTSVPVQSLPNSPDSAVLPTLSLPVSWLVVPKNDVSKHIYKLWKHTCISDRCMGFIYPVRVQGPWNYELLIIPLNYLAPRSVYGSLIRYWL